MCLHHSQRGGPPSAPPTTTRVCSCERIFNEARVRAFGVDLDDVPNCTLEAPERIFLVKVNYPRVCFVPTCVTPAVAGAVDGPREGRRGTQGGRRRATAAARSRTTTITTDFEYVITSGLPDATGFRPRMRISVQNSSPTILRADPRRSTSCWALAPRGHEGDGWTATTFSSWSGRRPTRRWRCLKAKYPATISAFFDVPGGSMSANRVLSLFPRGPPKRRGPSRGIPRGSCAVYDAGRRGSTR